MPPQSRRKETPKSDERKADDATEAAGVAEMPTPEICTADIHDVNPHLVSAPCTLPAGHDDPHIGANGEMWLTDTPEGAEGGTLIDAPAEIAPPTLCGQNLKDVDYRFVEAYCAEPTGHSGDHRTTDGSVTWPNEALVFEVVDPLALCEVCYPAGWPSHEYGASASCPHGAWTYPISR